MNQIHEDDWGEDSWSRHSGMPNDDSAVYEDEVANEQDADAMALEQWKQMWNV